MLSAQSDPMIVTLCLAAIDCHLCGRYRWAFTLGALAALGRPEVWPFLGLYTVWAWLRVPSMRWLIVVELVLVVLLWFGIPALTSRTPFVAASNALGSGRRLRSDRVFGTIGRFLDLNTAVLLLTALLAVVLALVRRDRVTLGLAAGVCAWVIVEIAFALHGWPGLGRYMFEPAGVVVALAGAGVGMVLAEARRVSRGVGWAGVALVVVIVVALVPPGVVAGPQRASRHPRPARADGRDRQALDGGRVARRAGAVQAVRRAADPVGVPDHPGLERSTSTSPPWATSTRRRSPAAGRSSCSRRTSHGGWRVQALHQRLAACRSLPG